MPSRDKVMLQLSSKALAVLIDKDPEFELHMKSAVFDKFVKSRIEGFIQSKITNGIMTTAENEISKQAQMMLDKAVGQVVDGGKRVNLNDAMKQLIEMHIKDYVMNEIHIRVMTAIDKYDKEIQIIIEDMIKENLEMMVQSGVKERLAKLVRSVE